MSLATPGKRGSFTGKTETFLARSITAKLYELFWLENCQGTQNNSVFWTLFVCLFCNEITKMFEESRHFPRESMLSFDKGLMEKAVCTRDLFVSLSGTELLEISAWSEKACRPPPPSLLCDQGPPVCEPTADAKWLKGNSDLPKGLGGHCGTDTPKRKSYLKRLMLIMVNMYVFLVSRMAYVLLEFHT